MNKFQKASVVILLIVATIFFMRDESVFYPVSYEGLQALFGALAVFVSAFGYGYLILRRAKIESFSLELFLYITTGFGVQSFLMMIFGFAGLVHLAIALLVLLGGLLPAIRYARLNAVKFKMPELDQTDLVLIATVAFAGIAIALTLPAGLLPPLFYDGLIYHLALPKYYIIEGKILYAPFNFFSFFPQATEMLYLLAMLVGAESAPGALTWLWGPLCFLGMWEVAKLHGGKRAGLWAILIGLGMPWAIICVQVTYIEMLLGAFMLASYLFAMRLKDNPRVDEAMAAAMAAGMAAGSKFTLAPFLAIIGIYTVVHMARAKAWKAVGAYFLFGALLSMPWYIRNWIFAGNPVAPFYFGSKYWTERQVAKYAYQHAHYGLGAAPFLQKLFASVATFIKPNLFPQSLGSGLAPLLAALFIPFSKNKKAVAPLLIVFAWGALIWTYTSQQPRFLVVPLIMLTIAGAVAVAELEKEKIVKWAATLIISLAVVNSLMIGIGSINEAFKIWHGILSRENVNRFITKRVPTYPASRKVWDYKDIPGKVLYVGETRTYYSTRRFIPISAWDIHPLVRAVIECPDNACVKQKLLDLDIGILIRGFDEEKRLSRQYNFMQGMSDEKKRMYFEFFDTIKTLDRTKEYAIYSLY